MKKLFILFGLIFFATINSFSQVVIYEIYGGGGNTGAIYNKDYIMLRNNGATSVNLAGYSVQYAPPASASWVVVPLIGSIPPGGFFLIQMGSGGVVGSALPTPDVTDPANTNINATDGKVILKNNTVAETTANPSNANILDLVGYGSSASTSETSPAPSPSNTQSITRRNNGQDTGNNSIDFTRTAPNPRNVALPVQITYFQTEANENQRVNIRWETAQEINSNVFILERSRNAVDYKTIAKIEAAGESNTTKRYSFTDELALFGTNYYRLSQIDKDGTMQIFRPQAVIIDDASLPFGVFSNPVFQNIFNVKVEDADEANFVLNDLNGKPISLKTNKLTQTIVEITPTENLPLGMYIIQVQTLGSLKMHKVLVVK
jgi:Lamin Tail Domain